MKTYTIVPGIASIVSIRQEGEATMVAIYMGPDPLPPQGANARVEWQEARSSKVIDPRTLPLKLVAEVNRHFGTVFSIRAADREAYLQGLRPWPLWPGWEVCIDDEEAT